MSASEDKVQAEPFERAKLPMVVAAVGVAGGLAIAGSVEKTAGGAIVLGAWVLGIAALHRLGRAGSVNRRQATGDRPQATVEKAADTESLPAERDDEAV